MSWQSDFQRSLASLQTKQPDPTPEPSLMDRVGGVRGLGAAAVRALSALAAFEGGPLGAGIAGGGEGLAELVEGSKLSPARIGVEAGMGAVPLAKIFKVGKPLASAIRGGAYAGVGEAGRQLARGEHLDPGAIGTSTLFGGAVNAGLAKLLGLGGKVRIPEGTPGIPTEPMNVQPTLRGPEIRVPGAPAIEPIAAEMPLAPEGLRYAPGPAGEIPVGAGIPYGAPEVPPYRAAAKRAAAAESAPTGLTSAQQYREMQMEQKMLSQAQKFAKEREDARIAAGKIADAKAGLVEQPPVITESFAADIPGGQERMTQRWMEAADEAGGGPGQAAARAAGQVFDRPLPRAGESINPLSGEPVYKPAAGEPTQLFLHDLSEERAPQTLEDLLGMRAEAADDVINPIQDVMPAPASAESIARAKAAQKREREAAGIFNREDVIDIPASDYSVEPLPKELPGLPPGPEPAGLLGPKPAPKPRAPRGPKAPKVLTPNQQARENSYQELLARLQAEGGAAPAVESAVPEAVAAEAAPLTGEAATAEAAGLSADDIATAKTAQLEADIANKAHGEWVTGGPDVPPPTLAQFFKTPAGAAGKNYRLAKAAAEAGEIPTAEHAKAALATENAAVKARKAAAQAAEQTNIQDQTDIAEAAQMLKQKGIEVTPEKLDLIERLQRLGRGEKGEISPELYARLGMGAGGALLGAAAGQSFGSPLLGAVAGGAAGAFAPSLAALLAKHNTTVEKLVTDPALGTGEQAVIASMSTPEGLSGVANRVIGYLPKVMRANLLTSLNLPNNVIVGPMGAGIFGALEAHLAGDPRGAMALKVLSDPVEMSRRFANSWAEAAARVGAAERGEMMVGEAANQFEAALATPGTLLTMGDVAVRSALESVGFTEMEARRLTLTFEPEFNITRRLADFGRGSAIGQTLLPFSRTAANIVEQGAMRLPFVGSLVQAARATPDPWRQQLAQQGLGAVLGLGAGAAGYYGPNTPFMASAVGNVGGPYALLTGMGYAGGKALAAGQEPAQAAGRAATEGLNELPLPTTRIPTELIQLLTAEPGTRKTPTFAVPSLVQQFWDLLMNAPR